MRFDFKHVAPLLPTCWASPLSLDTEYLSFVGSNILLSIVVQELVVILVNSMKRQKDMTLKDELPRSVGAQYTTGKGQRNSSRKNEETEPK